MEIKIHFKLAPEKFNGVEREFFTMFPHTLCNRLVSEARTSDNIENVTCKVCKKSYKKGQ